MSDKAEQAIFKIKNLIKNSLCTLIIAETFKKFGLTAYY